MSKAHSESAVSSSKVEAASQPLPALRQDVGATSTEYEETQSYLQGAKLYLITVALCTCPLITNIEIPIVTTALVGITGELGGFDKASWGISAYMLGYTVFRSFQGIGGAGNFALCSVIFIELVPSHKYALYTSSTAAIYSLSLALGPILGGAISQYTTWRWVFLINVPVAFVSAVIIFFSIPDGFPFHGRPRSERPNAVPFFSKQAAQRIDITGTILLLISTVLLVAALQEGGLRYPWKSGFVIALCTISGLGWIAFLIWERSVTLGSTLQEPVFPWRFAQNRVYIGLLLNTSFIGAAFFCTTFQLPQRFQVVNGLPPIQAGIRFLPFTLAAPFGSPISPAIAKVIGFALLSTLASSKTVVAAQYGYQVLAGFGSGANITLTLLLTPFCVQERDKGIVLDPITQDTTDMGIAVAMGTVSQFRVMGGVIGLSIVTAAFYGLVRQQLGELLSPQELTMVLQSPGMTATFPADVQEAIRVTFAAGYTRQMKILSGLAAGQLPASILMWQRDQIRI
ncbi:Uu.00g037430.m01.CDS01 [Anthostomella pinea]|uniref:Uu.00g037430.m01.CDS01 n=1 Tax=Anthostomella pinea TaxID=933095 RepID=A0AAI8VAL7_9PEZI|nr:Uu.00g037430.m01.CDS01 [Anthostomella pinea]